MFAAQCKETQIPCDWLCNCLSLSSPFTLFPIQFQFQFQLLSISIKLLFNMAVNITENLSVVLHKAGDLRIEKTPLPAPPGPDGEFDLQ